MTHDINKVTDADDKMMLVCSCGDWSVEVTDEKYIAALTARHSLTLEIWPFEQPPKYSKWPHNTPEDDEKDKQNG